MSDVDAVLQQLRALVGSGTLPEWPQRQFGAPVPGVPGWTGAAADNAHQASQRIDALRGKLADTYAAATPLVRQAAQVATVAQRNLDAIIAQWQDDKAGLTPYMDTSRGRAAYITLGQRRVDQGTRVLADTEQAFSALAARIHAAGAGLPHPLSGGAPAAAPEPIPSWGTQVDQVKKWWQSQTKAEQDALVREHPDEIGQLDGLPCQTRDAANRTMMSRDRQRVDQAAADHHVSTDEVKAHPQAYGLTATDVMRYTNADKVRAGLDDQQLATGADTYLLIYKPEAFGGKGRAAIAINNPDTAANVAVVVPGTSHSVTEGWLSAPDSRNLYQQMQSTSPGKNSVIAWMGYDAPNSLSDPRVASTPLAHEGGGLLSFDVNGIKATADTPAHYTVIGHSYGSTTVADAAWAGMKADDVVLIGSPGTDMAHNANDFHLPPGGHLYVGSASTDPITELGQIPTIAVPGHTATIFLGPDPALDGFGSVRFKAEVPGLTFNDHSHYYQPDTESLRSMGLIATGQGATLQSHGLTAPHRGDLLDRAVDGALDGPLGGLPDFEFPRIPGVPFP